MCDVQDLADKPAVQTHVFHLPSPSPNLPTILRLNPVPPIPVWNHGFINPRIPVHILVCIVCIIVYVTACIVCRKACIIVWIVCTIVCIVLYAYVYLSCLVHTSETCSHLHVSSCLPHHPHRRSLHRLSCYSSQQKGLLTTFCLCEGRRYCLWVEGNNGNREGRGSQNQYQLIGWSRCQC